MKPMLFNDIFKDVTASDVHVPTALGNQTDDKEIITEGYVDPDVKELTTRKLSARTLQPLDDQTSLVPFPYDPGALGALRPDQVPRFLGCLTNPELLPEATVKLAELTAMQNRVSTAKTNVMRTGAPSGKLPVVIATGGKKYIADGHHRLSAQWLNGDETAKVRFKDLEPVTNAMKRDWSLPLTVAKASPTGRELWAWASVIEKDGKPVIDHQGDTIDCSELEKAADGFMTQHRNVGQMHETIGHGVVVQSMVFSADLQKALGIDLGHIGWLVKMRIDDPALQKRIASGELRELSIGGRAIRQEI